MLYQRKECMCSSLRLTATLKQVLVILAVALIMTTIGLGYAVGETGNSEAFEERNRLVDMAWEEGAGAIPVLQEAINSENETVRYTAANLLVDLGEPARQALGENLAHEDVQVRYIVVGGLENLGVVDEHVKELVLDEDAVIRRRFYQDIMKRHLFVDGEPKDVLLEGLISAFDDAPDTIRIEIINTVGDFPLTESSQAFFSAAYETASDELRHEIIEAVAEHPLTESTRALLHRAKDREKAVVAAEGDEDKVGFTEETALIAFRRLLEEDMERMWELTQAGEWEKLLDEFGERDISSWPDTSPRGIPDGTLWANEPSEAYYRLATAYFELGRGEEAEEILRYLIESDDVTLGTVNKAERVFYMRVLNLYEENYQTHLRENEKVRDRCVNMRLDYANRLAESGREGEAQEMYERALEVEGISDEGGREGSYG